AKAGLGYLITQSVVFFELSDVMVGMVLIGVAGFVLDGLYVRFMDYRLHWMPKREVA
ncbi:MAG: ABC transporter permease, partial [Chloroflexi bacterium]|nr:ABC transporter permease [Chloroflexota bacterium]